jgi:hypothetical protein
VTEFLAIKNFEIHQHYKDRRPPWIKLHAAVLEDYAFSCLQDASKAHLMLLWVLASKLNNRIPNDPAWIARQIGATEPVDLQVLITAGFLVVVQDDSKPISQRSQDAMPETEGETETESEGEAGPPASVARVRERIAPRDRDAFDALVSRVSNPEWWMAECEAMLAGMPGHFHANGAQLGQAFHDMAANGKITSPNVRQFRRYVEGAIEESKNQKSAFLDAERVWDLLLSSGIHHMRADSEIDQACNTLLRDGIIRSVAEFKTLLKPINMSFLETVQNRVAAIRHIAQKVNGSVSKALA